MEQPICKPNSPAFLRLRSTRPPAMQRGPPDARAIHGYPSALQASSAKPREALKQGALLSKNG